MWVLQSGSIKSRRGFFVLVTERLLEVTKAKDTRSYVGVMANTLCGAKREEGNDADVSLVRQACANLFL